MRADLSAPGLRPSVETTLHAGLPQRFVLHLHCVETISHAVLEDGAARIAPLLDGLKWRWVPYMRPGLPLFRTITPGADIYVFANHGLVVAADTLEAAVALVETVGRRLARPIQAAPTRSARGVERAGYHFADAPALDAARGEVRRGRLALSRPLGVPRQRRGARSTASSARRR